MGNFSLSQPSGPYSQYYDNDNGMTSQEGLQDHDPRYHGQAASSVQHINVLSTGHDGSDHSSKSKRSDQKFRKRKQRVRYNNNSSTEPDSEFLSVSQTNFSEMPSLSSHFYNATSQDVPDCYTNTNNNGDTSQVSFAGEGEAEEQNGQVAIDSDFEDDADVRFPKQNVYSFHSSYQPHATSEVGMPVRPISANRPGSASSVKLAAKYTPVRRNSGQYPSQSPTKERNSYEFESDPLHSAASQESYSQQNSQDTIVCSHQPTRLSLSNNSQSEPKSGGSDPKIADKNELASSTEQSKKWKLGGFLPLSRKSKKSSQHACDPGEDMKITDL